MNALSEEELILHGTPWKPLRVTETDSEQPSFLFQFLRLRPSLGEVTEEGYVILITNQVHLWKEKMMHEEVMKRHQLLNSALEVPVDRILRHLEDVTRNEHSPFHVQRDPDASDPLLLVSHSKLSGLRFTWHFTPHLQHQHMLWRMMTYPLVCTVAELLRRQKLLQDVIASKEAQIDDFKSEGATLRRRHAYERPFDTSTFDLDMEHSKGFAEVIAKAEGVTFGEGGCQLLAAVQRQVVSMARKPSGKTTEEKTTAVPSDHIERHPEMRSPVKATGSDEEGERMKRRRDLEKRLEEERQEMMERNRKKKILKL